MATLASIPDINLAQIFSYLNGLSLLRVEVCSSSCHRVCQEHDPAIWCHNIHKAWHQLQWNTLSHELYNLFTRIKQLSISKLKKNLLGIDLHRCVEKIDFQRMLMAHLVFHRHMKKELAGSDPRFAGKYLTMHYPEWSLKISCFKASYAYTLKELQRKEMLLSELIAGDWYFTFKDYQDIEHNMWRTKFHEDFTMESKMQPDHVYTWRVISSPEDDAELRIQVDSYPVITATRITTSPNKGRWRMDNMYVTFMQAGSLDENSIPLF